MAELVVRLLRREDDRTGFSCGDAALDRFFRDYAGQNQFKLHLAVTWVAVAADDRVVGFATVAGGSIHRHAVPDDRSRRRMPDHPLPVLRLARLGVDQRAQGLGIGKVLVRHVLRLALGQRDVVGCVGVVTDAKPGAEAFYTSIGFVPLLGAGEGILHGDPQPMFLAIERIAAAVS